MIIMLLSLVLLALLVRFAFCSFLLLFLLSFGLDTISLVRCYMGFTQLSGNVDFIA